MIARTGVAGRVGGASSTAHRGYGREHQVAGVREARLFLEWLRAQGVSELAMSADGGRYDMLWNDPAGVRVDVSDYPSHVPEVARGR